MTCGSMFIMSLILAHIRADSIDSGYHCIKPAGEFRQSQPWWWGEPRMGQMGSVCCGLVRFGGPQGAQFAQGFSLRFESATTRLP
jgi:hypothetical protein